MIVFLYIFHLDYDAKASKGGYKMENEVTKKEEPALDEVVIRGTKFKKEEVEEVGKNLARRKTNKLRWTGVGLMCGGGTFVVIGIIITISDIKSIAMPIVFGIPFILGLIFFLTSFKKRDPLAYGKRYYERQLAAPAAVSANPSGTSVGQIAILNGRIVQLSRKPLVRLTFNGEDNSIQIFSEKRYSKVYKRSEVLDYELRVDNEVVISSSTKKGMGKSIAMGAIGHKLFDTGGAGMMAGALAASSKTSSSQKEVHHYTLLIKVRDLDRASYYMPIDTVQIAEEVITILDIIIGKGKPQEIEEKVEEPKPAPAKEDKVDKFTEIKKYKDLLDSGIITQEEFEQKKKDLL